MYTGKWNQIWKASEWTGLVLSGEWKNYMSSDVIHRSRFTVGHEGARELISGSVRFDCWWNISAEPCSRQVDVTAYGCSGKVTCSFIPFTIP